MNLPWDILLDILIRLRLKSIVRFRCVNHSWDNQLKCPKFLEERNDYAVEMGKFNLMFHNNDDMYTFHYDTTLSTCEESNHILYRSLDACPLPSKQVGIEVLGCCNGLVLFRHVTRCYLSSISYLIILWNPTTNECKRLRDPPSIGMSVRVNNYKRYEDYGFGYDEQIGDFKVVRLTESLWGDDFYDVHLYTLKSKSWRSLNSIKIDCLYNPRTPDMGRSPVNGCFHWIAQLQEGDFLHGLFVLRFEFERDEFDMVDLPEFDEDAQVSLCVLGGSLCCFRNDTKVVDVWELKDNEEEESWTKLFTIELEEHFDFVSGSTPLNVLKNGKIVLGLVLMYGSVDIDIVLYDPNMSSLILSQFIVYLQRLALLVSLSMWRVFFHLAQVLIWGKMISITPQKKMMTTIVLMVKKNKVLRRKASQWECNMLIPQNVSSWVVLFIRC